MREVRRGRYVRTGKIQAKRMFYVSHIPLCKRFLQHDGLGQTGRRMF